jgi:N-acetylglucosamine kinase-like BadF-type ATPase
MTRYFFGVDTGATKSHGLIADETGRAVGFAQAGSGNHEDVGYDGVVRTLRHLLADATASAGISPEQIAGAGFGIAGYDWPSERVDTLAAIGALGLSCPVEAVNDTIVGLVAGAEEGWGVALVAGTSNNCRGWDRRHREGRVMGNGLIFGEYGGSGELVMYAVQAVAKEWTRRGPPTALTRRFVERADAHDAADLLEGLSQGVYTIGAEAAPLVFETAQAGDAVARGVITWAAEELASLAVGVIRQLDLQNEQFDVVLVGSLYSGGPLFTEPLRAAILAEAPGARLVRLTAPPVVGAVLIGMQLAGLSTPALRPPLVESTLAHLELVTE